MGYFEDVLLGVCLGFVLFLSRKQFPVTGIAGASRFVGEIMNRAFPKYCA